MNVVVGAVVVGVIIVVVVAVVVVVVVVVVDVVVHCDQATYVRFNQSVSLSICPLIDH